MKKLLLIILIGLLLICNVTAKEPSLDTLTKIEGAVLGIEYTDQKLEQRLNRLEEYLYGKIQTGSTKIRLSKILETTKYNLLKEDNTIAENEEMDYIEPVDNSVDYPVLDKIESKLKLPKQKNLQNRLATIEQKIFNKSYDKEDFFTRVERIKSKMKIDTTLAEENNYDDYDSFSGGYNNYFPKTEFGNNFFEKGSANVRYKLTALEQRLLKNTFKDETNNDRLARLENVVFDTSFYNDDEHERLDRLETALKAKKSSPKYDNNKFQQGLNTAMQIGAMVLMVLAFIL